MSNQLTFGIIGYGRFGRLWAEHLRSCGPVSVYDTITITPPAGIQKAALKEVAAADIIFIAVPIVAFESCCKEIAPLLKPGTIVIDTCSVKEYPVKIMRQIFSPTQSIIATHPLFGPDSVAANGLAGKKIVVYPVRASSQQLGTVENIYNKFSLQIVHATPEEHDRQMARSQALVHFLGRGLLTLELRPQHIATPDYESLLRMQDMVRHDTWQLFVDMQRYNTYAQVIRKDFLTSLETIESQLTS